MIRRVALRIRADDAPELVPSVHRRLGNHGSRIVETTLPYTEAEKLFLLDDERRRTGLPSGLTSFVIHNEFTEKEREAEWFHAWVDRLHHDLTSPENDLLPECPVCGIVLAVQLCALVPSHKLAAPLVVTWDDLWLVNLALAAELVRHPWKGFSLVPAFTSKKRRRAYIERRGLQGVPTVIPIGEPIPETLSSLVLRDPDDAGEADRWILVATRMDAEIDPSTPMGVRPGTRTSPAQSGVTHIAGMPPMPYGMITSPSPCGHLPAQRLLGPLLVQKPERLDGDLSLTRQGIGVEKRGLFRPPRKRILSRRLASFLRDRGVRTLDFQPLVTEEAIT